MRDPCSTSDAGVGAGLRTVGAQKWPKGAFRPWLGLHASRRVTFGFRTTKEAVPRKEISRPTIARDSRQNPFEDEVGQAQSPRRSGSATGGRSSRFKAEDCPGGAPLPLRPAEALRRHGASHPRPDGGTGAPRPRRHPVRPRWLAHASPPASGLRAPPMGGRSVSEQMAHEVIQVEDLVDDADRFDIIHSHVEYLLPLASGRLTTPVVSTLHGRLDRPQIRVRCQTYRPALASISDAQRTALADLDLDWVATVYNGLPLRDLFRLGRGDGSYLAFLGRISEEKDPETPIRVAIRAGTPIKIAARVDPADEPSFRARVMPHL